MRYLYLGYWFNFGFWPIRRPFEIAGLVLIAVLIILAIVAFYLRRYKKGVIDFWGPIFPAAWVSALIGLFLTAFYYEELNFFCARIWILLWLLSIVFWAIMIFRRLRNLMAKQKDFAKQQEFEKYLPKKKA